MHASGVSQGNLNEMERKQVAAFIRISPAFFPSTSVTWEQHGWGDLGLWTLSLVRRKSQSQTIHRPFGTLPSVRKEFQEQENRKVKTAFKILRKGRKRERRIMCSRESTCFSIAEHLNTCPSIKVLKYIYQVRRVDGKCKWTLCA